MFTLQTNLAHVFSVGLACCYLVRLDDWALPIALEMSRAPPLSFEIINCILYKTGGGGGLCVFIYLARRSGSERVTLWFRTSGLWCKRQVSLGSDFCQILNTIWSCGLGIWGGGRFFLHGQIFPPSSLLLRKRNICSCCCGVFNLASVCLFLLILFLSF